MFKPSNVWYPSLSTSEVLMVINGKSVVFVNGKPTRVLGHRFNRALKATPFVVFTDEKGTVITPSKGSSWDDVALGVRKGESFTAVVGKPRARAKKTTESATA